jgi:hypothetical protein
MTASDIDGLPSTSLAGLCPLGGVFSVLGGLSNCLGGLAGAGLGGLLLGVSPRHELARARAPRAGDLMGLSTEA